MFLQNSHENVIFEKKCLRYGIVAKIGTKSETLFSWTLREAETLFASDIYSQNKILQRGFQTFVDG